GRRELLEERPVSGREVDALETAGNFGAAIDQHRPPVRAPLGKDIRLSEPGHGPWLSTRDRVDEVLACGASRQNELPVRGEPPFAGAFRSHRSRRASLGFLQVETRTFSVLVAVDEHA